MIRDAVMALQRNISALVLYIGLTTAYYVLKIIGEQSYIAHFEVNPQEGLPRNYLFISGIVTAAVFALAQAIAFTRLSQDLDRPFWKVNTIGEGMRRFFAPWFLLNMVSVGLLLSSALLPEENDFRGALQMIWLLWAASYLPFGATVMFYGHFGKQEIRQTLSTVSHELPSYILLMFIAFCAIVLVLSLGGSGMPLWAKPGLSIVDGYMDCLLFAATWFVCRRHRDTQSEQDDDFGF
jgi:hypothetical protein